MFALKKERIMKNIILSFAFILSFGLTNIFATIGDNGGYSIVEVVTPVKIVYDDGMYRKVYSSFIIYDEIGNKIVSSGEVFDFAAKVKLPKGSYRILTLNDRGDLLEKNFVIDKENVFQIIFCK